MIAESRVERSGVDATERSALERGNSAAVLPTIWAQDVAPGRHPACVQANTTASATPTRAPARGSSAEVTATKVLSVAARGWSASCTTGGIISASPPPRWT